MAIFALLLGLAGCPAMYPPPDAPPSPPPVIPPPPPPPPSERRHEAFPWPPPRASAEYAIPDRWLRTGASTTLGDIADRLENAVKSASYRRWSYATPERHGFVLITQMEQMRRDGTPFPVPERWSADTPSVTSLSLFEFIKSLAVAPTGHYRIIAFVVTDRRWNRTGEPPTEIEASEWFDSGLDGLPPEIAATRYSRAFRTTALVYEFVKRHGHEAAFVPESRTSGIDHLRRTGITKPLSMAR